MKNLIFNSILLLALSLSVISCSENEDELNYFSNQNIPKDLCGTYYQVERGGNYYSYLTINPDGTMEGVYVSDGNSIELRGECYYNEEKMIFYYKNGGKWIQLVGAERSVVEWTSEYLVLGYFNASFLTKSKQTPEFVGKEHNEGLIGQWKYNQTETLILKENGLGSREFSSPVEYDYKNIVSWFTFNEWLYIKYDGQPDYRIMRFNLSGATLYLYYCDILGAGSKYDYHKDNNSQNIK